VLDRLDCRALKLVRVVEKVFRVGVGVGVVFGGQKVVVVEEGSEVLAGVLGSVLLGGVICLLGFVLALFLCLDDPVC
jgi:hypothetical protein